MNNKLAARIILLGALAFVAFCAFAWSNMSRTYIARRDMPPGSTANKATKGNVCIVSSANQTAEPLTCIDITLFPGVYEAIGVKERSIVEWQNKNGFDSGGVDSSGSILAPGYPIFSRLAWTLVEPVYLTGDELSELLKESGRILNESSDPVVRANIERLATLAEKAQKDSAVLRFFG